MSKSQDANIPRPSPSPMVQSLITSLTERRQSWLNQSSSNFNQSVTSANHENHLSIPVVSLDSDSETESSFKTEPIETSETSKEQVVAIQKTCNSSNNPPKLLLNYSIPVSDSDGDDELIDTDQTNETQPKGSEKLKSEPEHSNGVRKPDNTETNCNEDLKHIATKMSQINNNKLYSKNIYDRKETFGDSFENTKKRSKKGLKKSHEKSHHKNGQETKKVHKSKKDKKYKLIKNSTIPHLKNKNEILPKDEEGKLRESFQSAINNELPTLHTTKVQEEIGVGKVKSKKHKHSKKKKSKEFEKTLSQNMEKSSCRDLSGKEFKKPPQSSNLYEQAAGIYKIKKDNSNSESQTYKQLGCNSNRLTVEDNIQQSDKCFELKKRPIDKASSSHSCGSSRMSSIKDNMIQGSKTEKSCSHKNTNSSPLNTKRLKKVKKSKDQTVCTEDNEPDYFENVETPMSNSESLNNQNTLRDYSSPITDISREGRIDTQELSFSPFTKELVCVSCRSWVVSQQVRLCECKLICASCSSLTGRCSNCGLTFEQDKRFSNFHARICSLISQPCSYQSFGCMAILKPGDGHESECQFKPFVCFKCNKEISQIKALEHFHSEHYLTGKNNDVKVRDFQMNPESGKLEACCVLSGKKCVYLILNKSEEGENAQFIVNSGCVNDAFVKLLFSKRNSVFRYECDNRSSTNSQSMGLSFIDVSTEAINYWFKDECVLDIFVRTRIKRKSEVQSSRRKKKDQKRIKEINS